MAKILWIGPVVEASEVGSNRAISAAANHWQWRVLENLSALGNRITVIGHHPDRIWPIGRLVPRGKRTKCAIQVTDVKYLNLPVINRLHLQFLYEQTLLSKLSQEDVIFTYNWSPRPSCLCEIRKTFPGTKWIAVVADGPLPSLSDCVIVLSNAAYASKNITGMISFQGGIDTMFQYSIPAHNPKTLVYAGDYTRLTGIEEFIEQFQSLQIPNCELHLYGKIPGSLGRKIRTHCTKVKAFGFVPEDVLYERLASAWALVNPRSSSLELKQNTFPSKLLLYLRFGKPIIATESDSIPARYSAVLTTYLSNDLASLRDAVEKVLSLPPRDLENLYERVRTVVDSDSWTSVVSRLVVELRARGVRNLA